MNLSYSELMTVRKAKKQISNSEIIDFMADNVLGWEMISGLYQTRKIT